MSGEPLRPIQLLFVDDDTSYMAGAQHLLNRYQPERFTILWRQDGASAVDLLQKQRSIDLILIDYYLPEVDGLEVTREIRRRQIDVPIIRPGLAAGAGIRRRAGRRARRNILGAERHRVP